MTSILDVETWICVMSGAVIAVACLAIRLCWRRGKRLEDL